MKTVSFFIDSTRAFEFPASRIVFCPPFDCADLLAEEEVRGDEAVDERDGRGFIEKLRKKNSRHPENGTNVNKKG